MFTTVPLTPEQHDVSPLPLHPPDGVAIPDELALPSPEGLAHPLARVALDGLVEELRSGPPLGIDFDAPGGGKMFGVLVVVGPDGLLGVLRGFSGMLGRAWFVDGYAPPIFDARALAGFWPAGEAELDALTAELASAPADARPALARARRARSRELWRDVLATYRIPSLRGEVRPMTELFAPRQPPAGAGDCVGPKLLAHAIASRLRPLALAELWWGAPVGARRALTTWPPCRDKCGPILDHMLADA